MLANTSSIDGASSDTVRVLMLGFAAALPATALASPVPSSRLRFLELSGDRGDPAEALAEAERSPLSWSLSS